MMKGLLGRSEHESEDLNQSYIGMRPVLVSCLCLPGARPVLYWAGKS
jgi:hypothetical protein